MIEDIIQEAPTYGDMYLKFTDEAAATAALAGYEGSIDVIGVIYDVDNTDPENPVATAIPGWHVNTRGPLLPALQAYAITPTLPRRVWA